MMDKPLETVTDEINKQHESSLLRMQNIIEQQRILMTNQQKAINSLHEKVSLILNKVKHDSK